MLNSITNRILIDTIILIIIKNGIWVFQAQKLVHDFLRIFWLFLVLPEEGFLAAVGSNSDVNFFRDISSLVEFDLIENSLLIFLEKIELG